MAEKDQRRWHPNQIFVYTPFDRRVTAELVVGVSNEDLIGSHDDGDLFLIGSAWVLWPSGKGAQQITPAQAAKWLRDHAQTIPSELRAEVDAYDRDVEAAARVKAAMAEPEPIVLYGNEPQILAALEQGPLNKSELARTAGMDVKTIGKALGALEKRQLVTVEVKGKSHVVAITQKGKKSLCGTIFP